MKRIFLMMSAIALFVACTGEVKDSGATGQSLPKIEEGDAVANVNLTVAEGKRLIAKGIVNHPQIKRLLQKGTIVITNGTTNTYIAEELVNLDVPHGSFVTGHITPSDRGNISEGLPRTSYITIVDGERVELSAAEAMQKTQKGDVVFKGANLLNYEKKQAAACIGAPSGGTMALIQETEAHVIVPVGLEKETFGDLHAYAKLFDNCPEGITPTPRIWVHSENVEIFTEIEALKTVATINVAPYAAGGIAGREGGISLIIYGKPEEVQKALDLVASVQGEAPFVK